IIRLAGVDVDAITLDQPVLTIGRAADAAITLAHPFISRYHAEIRRQAGTTTIVDLDSANGIMVDGTRLPAHQLLPLMPGAVVQIGPYTLTAQTLEGAEHVRAALAETTVRGLHVKLRIHIDERERAGEVEEITESAFFRHLSAEHERLRLHVSHPAVA